MVSISKQDKKIIKLVNAIRKCSLVDLQLFVALCLIRFDNLNDKNNVDDTIFMQVIDIYDDLNKNNKLVNLLK